MHSVSLLVSTQRPASERGGTMELGPALVREVRDSFPLQRKLFIVFFVSRTEPYSDLDLRTEIVCPDGSASDASDKRVPLRGTWDFATGSVDLGLVDFPTPGPYRFNLYVKERASRDWPREPHCFWLIYATKQGAAAPTQVDPSPKA